MKNFIKNTMKTVTKNLGKIIPTFAEENWSKNNSYDNLTIVYSNSDNSLYISKKEVPVNIEITNTEYWQFIVRTVGYSKEEIDIKFSQKQNLLTFDNIPTEDSMNPVTSDGIKAYIDTVISTLYRYKGSCTYAELPSSGNKIGDVWNVTDAHGSYPAGTNYAWDGSEWDALGGNIDLSDYALKSEIPVEYGSAINSVKQKGTGAVASGVCSFAEGGDNLEGASTPQQGDELLYSTAEGYGSHAEGAGYAKGKYSHAEGGGNSIVSGKKTRPTAEGAYSHAEGTHTYAKGNAAHAEGSQNDAIGDRAHAEGQNTIASANQAHTEGKYTKATASHAHAEGFGSDDGSSFVEANGIASHAEGEATIANGRASHSENKKTIARGNYAHAEGNLTYAVGDQSHSEGYGSSTQSSFTISGAANTTTYTSSANHGLLKGQIVEYLGTYAFITEVPSSITFTTNKTLSDEAISNVTVNIRTNVALGIASHVEGYKNIAAENQNHAEGSQTKAIGKQSHTQGYQTIAYNNVEHAEGRWNKSNVGSATFGDAGNTIHSIGIGSSDSNRKNAIEVRQNGDVYVDKIGEYNIGNSPKTLQTVIKNSENLQKIAYNDLVSLRGNFIPGMQYRITDYVTSVDSNITALQSANHPFDIIVTADSPDTLNEDAKACIHLGSSYFANSNLSAWKIKYSIFNDKNKFNWAKANGKGVIYYMKDEFDNEAWFDFKNIQIKGSRNGSTEIFYHIFSKIVFSNIVDSSLDGTARSNIIGPSFVDTIPSTPTGTPIFTNKRDINYCIFYGASYNNIIGPNSSYFPEDDFDKINWFTDSYNNILGSYCRGNKLTYTFGNTLLDDCYKNEIYLSYDNHLSKGCHHITINYGWNNNFEDGVHTITITGTSAKPSYGNEFKKNCRTHTLGNDARYNIFGEGTEGNTLGNVCHGNRFEQYANNNTLANSCSYNHFNEQCSNNTLPTYTRYLCLEGNNNSLVITKSSGTYLWYINVEKGLSNQSISIAAESDYNNCNQRFIIKDGSSYKIIGMNDIVNSFALIIEGSTDATNIFNVDSGQPNFTDAANAFIIGRTVILKVTNSDNEVGYEPIIRFSEANGLLLTKSYTWQSL